MEGLECQEQLAVALGSQYSLNELNEGGNWQVVGVLLPIGSTTGQESVVCKAEPVIELNESKQDFSFSGQPMPHRALFVSTKVLLEDQKAPIFPTENLCSDTDTTVGAQAKLLLCDGAAESNDGSSEQSVLQGEEEEHVNWLGIDSESNIIS
ncbi:hypothetical protein EGW08_001664, partial [Elysia chlorotica]